MNAEIRILLARADVAVELGDRERLRRAPSSRSAAYGLDMSAGTKPGGRRGSDERCVTRSPSVISRPPRVGSFASRGAYFETGSLSATSSRRIMSASNTPVNTLETDPISKIESRSIVHRARSLAAGERHASEFGDRCPPRRTWDCPRRRGAAAMRLASGSDCVSDCAVAAGRSCAGQVRKAPSRQGMQRFSKASSCLRLGASLYEADTSAPPVPGVTNRNNRQAPAHCWRRGRASHFAHPFRAPSPGAVDPKRRLE